MAKLYKCDGTVKDVEPKNKKDGFGLQELYNLIGCRLVELVYLPNDEIIIVDEEGLINNSELNIKITQIARQKSGYQYTLFGNAVLCKSEEFK
jgi:hypothetical protein